MNNATAAIIANTASESFVPFGPFIITECPDHGTTACDDRRSLVSYVEMALSCHALELLGVDHGHPGLDCWVCCDKMVIDPDDVLS